jgi:hypothetical protein
VLAIEINRNGKPSTYNGCASDVETIWKGRYKAGGASLIIGGLPPRKPEGMGWRVALSIVSFFGSMIAVILWLFFFAGSFNVYQNIAVVVVIFLVFLAVMGATWASWGMKQGAWWSEKGDSRPGEDKS